MKFRIPALLLTIALCFGGCSDSDDDESYPSLIHEFAMAQANGEGLLTSFVTDAGNTYSVVNPVKGMKANEVLRVLLGFEVQDAGKARVYSAQAIIVLPNNKGQAELVQDPVGVESVWMAGGFLNLHLLPRTQGQKQAWAFQCDTLENTLGGKTYQLSLWHDQLDDPTSYSSHFYTCVDLDSVATAFLPGDSVIMTIASFKGARTWQFGKLDK